MANSERMRAVSFYSDGPVWEAFGLSRAAYLVVPRRTLQSMPYSWQQRFVALMDEAHAQLPEEAFPEYSVRRKERGRLVADPLREYRHTGPVQPKASTTLANVTPPRDLRTQLPKEADHA